MTNKLDNPPEGEPSQVMAGDSWIWRRSDLVSDYPVAAYQLKYAFKRMGDAVAPVVINAAVVSGTYQVSVPPGAAAGQSGSFTAGDWQWAAFVIRTADGARVEVASGRITVLADRTSDASDPRVHAEKVLANIEAVIESRATQDVLNYTIAGRSLAKMSPEQLMQWREYYRREVNRLKMADRARNGKATGRTQAVRFIR